MHEFSLNSFSEVTGQPSGQAFYRVSHQRQDVGASFPGVVATAVAAAKSLHFILSLAFFSKHKLFHESYI